jgi:GNAT superfamily N-acetyltransferase
MVINPQTIDRTMILRTATPSDAQTIASHNVAMALETEGRELDPSRTLLGVMAIIEDRSKGFYLLAEEDRTVMGQVMVTAEWSDWRNGEFWWVQSVYVRPEHRRNGVLSALLSEIRDRCSRSEGCVGIRLYVDEHNVAAQEAYSRLGLGRSRYGMYEWEKCP